MSLYAVPGMRVCFGFHENNQIKIPPAWSYMTTEVHSYCKAKIEISKNEICIKQSIVNPGINYFDNGIVIVSGLPLIKSFDNSCNSVEKCIDFLKDADGVFSAVGYNPKNKYVYVLSDFMGIMPLFLQNTSNRFIVSTTTTGFMKSKLDVSGWGAFLSLGHALGDHTMVDGVRRVSPGILETYNTCGKLISYNQYWCLISDNTCPTTKEVAHSLKDNALSYLSKIDNTAILLSGGFDSRLILCVLLNLKINVNAIIVNHKDEMSDADAFFAKQIAKKTNVSYCLNEPPQNFFSSYDYLSYIQKTDASIRSLYLFIACVGTYIPKQGLWEGMIPGFGLPIIRSASWDSWSNFLLHETQGLNSETWVSAKTIFEEDIAYDMWKGFKNLFHKEISRYDETSEMIWQFVLYNRMRFRTSQNPLMAYSYKAQPLLLGCSQSFWSHVASIPYEEKKNHSYYIELFKNEFPIGTEVPFISGRKMINIRGKKYQYKLLKALSQIHHWQKINPNKARLLGLKSKGFSSSNFLYHPAIFEAEVDEKNIINWKVVNKKIKDNSLSLTDRWLLFHWKAWKWSHEGLLFKNFEINTG